MILANVPLPELILGISAACIYAVLALAARRFSTSAIQVTLFVAWVLHAITLALSLFGATPKFGFAPALSTTAWFMLTVYAVESQFFPKLQARWAFAGLGSVAVLLALIFPGSMLPATASVWLPLHFALGIASYGMFAAAVLHAWLMARAEKEMREAIYRGLPLLTIEKLIFRFVKMGFALLSATLLAGWIFGESLYGKNWSWNHKMIFSTLAWCAFAVLLLGRMRFGWRGRSAVRGLYIGTALLLLGYVGTRFVVEIILGR